MRRVLQGRAGMGLTFILGLLIATAGTATATKLITGKQIKDGSISAKDLSKAVRAQIARTGAGGPAGPQGPGGAKGDTGAKGEPAPTLATFANTGGVALTGSPAVVTDTAGQPPGGSTGAIGGPITIPGGGRYTQITVVEVKTSAAAGTLTCTLQASVNGGAYFDAAPSESTTNADLRFTLPGGTFNNATPRTINYRVLCDSTLARTDTVATLSTIVAYKPAT